MAAWAETETVLAVDLGDGTDDPRATAPDLLRRALAAMPERARASGRVAMRADAGYFAGQLARAAPRRGHRLRDRRQADRAAVAAADPPGGAGPGPGLRRPAVPAR